MPQKLYRTESSPEGAKKLLFREWMGLKYADASFTEQTLFGHCGKQNNAPLHPQRWPRPNPPKPGTMLPSMQRNLAHMIKLSILGDYHGLM